MYTVIIVKPDGVERRLVGKIISRFEDKGLVLTGIKMLVPPKEWLEAHYEEHKGKDFYENLIEFVASGSVVVMIWSGDDAVAQGRSLTKSIREDYGTTIRKNVIHASDSDQSAKREVEIWFS